VGNLPYNISSPLLFHLLENRDKVMDMTFMLQKEVVLWCNGSNNTLNNSVICQKVLSKTLPSFMLTHHSDAIKFCAVFNAVLKLPRLILPVINPLIEKLNTQGLNLVGSVPADTAFTPDALKGVDCVLAMYHDQGLPVLKTLGFKKAVNITLGLPFIRTSVDHGTADQIFIDFNDIQLFDAF
jgi:hypothetical protein